MNVEQILTDELRVVASSVDAPPAPPTGELIREAERARRRARLTRVAALGAVAAAVVAAIVIGNQVGRPSSAPEPAPPSPSYYASGVPYVLQGILYIDHKAQPGQWSYSTTTGEYTAAVAFEPAMQVKILHDGEVIATLDQVYSGVTFSPDGNVIAWVTADDGTLVVRDLAAGRELGRAALHLPVPPNGEGGVTLHGVQQNGTVYYFIGDQSWRWAPGQRQATKVAGSAVPNLEAPNLPGFPAATSLFVSPDQLWGAWLTEGGAALAVQKPNDPGSRFTITLPGTVTDPYLKWLSTTRLRLNLEPSATSAVGCDIVTRSCSLITDVDEYGAGGDGRPNR